ncbi:Ig-like domain-containing protein [Shimia sp.]|uniref:Ig-like domain-containing protein n=1 Tax=Shimia sp. TaxID=1954381 RepID=UPI003BAC8BCE
MFISVEAVSNLEETSGVDPNFLNWTVSLDGPSADEVTVDFRLLAGTGGVGSSGSSTGQTDAYGSLEGTLTFAPGETSKTVSYRIDADAVDETDEAVVLELFDPSGAALAGDAPVIRTTGWILDDDGTGNNLALFVSRPVVLEGDSGQTQASFDISLSRPAPESFTVDYTTIDGSALAGEDYAATSGTLTFAVGQTSASVTVPVFGDTKIEPSELFTLDFTKPAPVANVSLGSAEIFDDDAGGSAPTINVSAASNFEATSGVDPNFLSWTVSLDGPSADEVTVDFRLLAGTGGVGSSGSSTGQTDAYGTLEGTLTFAPGETSKTVSYRIDADAVDETDEAVVLELFDPSGAALAGDAPVIRTTGWILDDDGTGNNLALFVSRPVVLEGDSGQTQASFDISLSRPAPESFTVDYTTIDGSALAGEDYAATSGTLTFAAGQTSASVTVPVFGDTKIEPSELFTLDFTKPAPVANVSLGSAEIFDDDAGGSDPTINVSAASNFEATSGVDPNFLSWTVSLDGPSANEVTVDFRLLAGTGGVGSSGSSTGQTDAYGTLEGTLTFAPGETSKTVSYRIDADAVDETDEAVVLELFDPSGAALAGDAPVIRTTGWILDDDGTGNNLALFVSRPVVLEGDSGQTQASFDISLSRPAPESFTVDYTTIDGSALAGEDYAATSGTLTFAAGQTSASVTVPVFGDTKIEPSELFTLDFTKPAPVANVSLGSAEIFDDDAGGSAPTINVSAASNFEATSGVDPNFLSWTVSLDGPSADEVTVDFRLLAGTGGVGSSGSSTGQTDAYGTLEGTLTFAPGETSKTVSYRIDADAVDETDEAVVLELFDPSGAALAGDAPVIRTTGWILDDDGTGNNLALFVSRPVVLEGDSGQTQASFDISLSRPAPESFTVDYTTIDGSALAGEDYAATSGTLTFAAGQTSASVTVPVFGDTKIEPSELFTLDFTKPAPVANVSLGSAEIFDDDAGGSDPTINVSAASNFEATSGVDPNFLSWTVSLDGPSANEVTVDFRLLAGTGGVGSSGSSNGQTDAYGTLEGTLTFAPGETSKTVSYRIDADAVDETDEAVVLELFDPSGAALAGDAPVIRTTGWILDDDGTGNNLALFVSRPVVLEGDSGQTQASFDISLSRPAPESFTVDYTTIDGSALAGEDYAATSGTLTFAAGQTSASVTVPVFGDTKVEPSELFTLDFTKPAPVANVSLGSAEIFDDDAGGSAPTINVSAASNFEATSGVDPNFLSWTVSLDGPSADEVTVDFRLLAGTGGVGSSGSSTGQTDAYGTLEGTLTFAPGETSKTVSYRIDADAVDETDEAVVLELFDPSGAALAGDAPVIRTTGWILDDDGTGNNLALFVSSPEVIENLPGGAIAVFDISLSRPADKDLSFAFQTNADTATANADYAPQTGVISFTEGQTRAFVSVPIVADLIDELDETFTLAITPTADLASGNAGTVGTATIIENGPPPPEPPVAAPITASFGEDETGRLVDLLDPAFVSDPNGDDLDVENVQITTEDGRTVGNSVNPETGLLVLGDGQFEDLAQGETFDISVSYDVADGGDSVGNSATITITGANDDPLATNDTAQTGTGAAVELDVLGNDADIDGDALTVSEVGNANNGTTELTPDGSIRYTPNDGFTGTDSFTYTVSDGKGGTDTATVSVEVGDQQAFRDFAEFQMNIGNATTLTFDEFNAQDTLSGTEFDGVTIVARDINVIDPTSLGLVTGSVNVNSAPNGISASIFQTSSSAIGFDNGDDNFEIVFDEPAEVAGLWIGNLGASHNDPTTPTTIQFLSASGIVLFEDTVTQASDGIIGSGANNRIFCGLSSDVPIARIVVLNAGGDGDGIILDDIVFGDANLAPTSNDDSGAGFETNEDTGFVTASVLGNDADVDGDTLTVSALDTTGTLGAVTNNGDGTFDYDPNGAFESLGVGDSTTDSFTYTVSDGNGGTDTATVTISVTGVNDAPVAADDSASTGAAAAIDIAVRDNDSDVEGDTLTISEVGDAANGTTEINSDGTIRYTPNDGFSGSDSFTYTIDDGNGGTDTATVTVTVAPDPQQPPQVAAITAGFGEDETGRMVDLLDPAFVSDPNGDPLTVENVLITTEDGRVLGTSLDPNSGKLTLDDGQFEDLAQDESFEVTVAYDVSDGSDSTANTATLTITGANDQPVATDDSGAGFETDEDTGFVTASVLGNDADVDGDTLTVSGLDTTGTLGAVTNNDDGTFDYDPNGAFESLGAGDSTTDSFTYTVSDGNGGTDTATVTISVTGVNDAPVAADDSASTGAAAAIDIAVRDNDSDVEGDTLTISEVGDAANGTTEINSDGTIRYTPNDGFSGSDSFTYTIDDGNGGTDTATVTVTVAPDPQQPPQVAAITAGFGEDETGRMVDLLDPAFVSDPNGDPLTVENVLITTEDGRVLGTSLDPNSGKLTLDDGQFEDLAQDESFEVTVAYDVSDGSDSTANTATLTITGANDQPVATDDSGAGFETDEDTGFVTASVLGNDADVDGDTLTVSALDTTGTLGAVTNNGDGTFDYDPNGAFESLGVGDSTTDSFTYTVSDGNGGTDTATVTISVTGVNDAPVAADDSASTGAAAAIDIAVRDNDSDVEGDTLTISEVGDAANGTTEINSDGTIRYTPNDGFSGSDSFTYTIDDGNDGSGTATVTVTVAPDPQQPPQVAAITSGFGEDETGRMVDLLDPAFVSDPNGDPLTVENVLITTEDGRVLGTSLDPNSGKLTLDDGQFEDLAQDESFEVTVAYDVSDGSDSTANTATLTITGANDQPVANDDSGAGFETDEDTGFVTASVLGNDADVDGDTLTVSGLDTTGTLGAVTNNDDGTFDYDPNGAFESLGAGDSTTDSFTYTVSDGNGGTDTATVTISVTGVNDAPVAADDSASTGAAAAIDIAVRDNDSDVEGDTLTISEVGDAANGTTEINSDGTIRYTPNDGFSGSDSFTYTIDDGNGGTDTATVTVTVQPPSSGGGINRALAV